MATKWKPMHTFGAIALVALVSAAIKHELFQRRLTAATANWELVEQRNLALVTDSSGKVLNLPSASPEQKNSPTYRCGNQRHRAAAPIPLPPPPLPSPTPSPTASSSPERYRGAMARAVADFQRLGLPPHEQSIVVMNRDGAAIAAHNSLMPLAAPATAELANTLAHLETWSPHHRFVTRIYTSGTVKRGVLQGSVWVQSSMPAELLWETSHDIAARLRERGIRTIEGDLTAIGSTYLNVDRVPLQPLEGIEVRGNVLVEPDMPDRASLLLSYPSQPLLAILKARNTFGRNASVETLAAASAGESSVFSTVDRVRSTSSNSVLGRSPAALATTRIRVGDSTHQRFSALATAKVL
ncbi:MAG: D-alanyl-D-alanine carboxypeptidase, partial [Cyanobacteria bacterium J06648_11]